MSITRIHAIKATVKRSIAYICNPAKTDGETLITAFGTTVEYAPAMFTNALKKTDPSDPNLAYHLIQSFAPGEVGAKEAHEIGKELAERLLGGRYSYIVSTHTDKNHCHNHIIFCAADNITHKKYHDCKRSYWNIRHINDELCEEHNLSVIKENKHIGKSYKEWMADKAGTSWKSKLKSDINETIKQAHTYDEFLDLMKSKGYEIKDAEISPEAHKYIGFRAPGQERWVRGRPKSLGDDFTKERIRERIEEKARIRAERMKRLTKRNPSMIDTSQDKFAESPGLMRWAEKQNLKAAAQIQSNTGLEARVCVPGHMLRGGAPSAYDRVLSTQFGVHAAYLIAKERYGRTVAKIGNKITSNKLEDIAGKTKFVDTENHLVIAARDIGVSFGD